MRGACRGTMFPDRLLICHSHCWGYCMTVHVLSSSSLLTFMFHLISLLFLGVYDIKMLSCCLFKAPSPARRGCTHAEKGCVNIQTQAATFSSFRGAMLRPQQTLTSYFLYFHFGGYYRQWQERESTEQMMWMPVFVIFDLCYVCGIWPGSLF